MFVIVRNMIININWLRIISRSFFPNLRIPICADNSQYFNDIGFFVDIEMNHVWEFRYPHTPDFLIPYGENLRVFTQPVYLCNGGVQKPFAEFCLRFVVPFGNVLNITKSFRYNLYFVLLHQAFSVFWASSQSISLSGFLRTFSKRSITIC